MRLVEGVGRELLPVGPDFLQHLRVVAVFLPAFDEHRLHLVNDGLLLLSHRLSQGVALPAGEVGELSREQHHLLLIDRDAVCVLEILLHARDVVPYLLLAVLACDEGGYVVHRSRAVEGIHGYEVLEDGGVECPQVFLHSRRFKLESPYGASFLVQLVCRGVVDGYVVEVDVYAPTEFHVLHRLFLLRQCLQSEEVHLYQAGRFDDVSVVLCHGGLDVGEVGVVGGRDGHMVRDGVTADDEAAGVDAGVAHGALKHLGVFYGVAFSDVCRGLCLLQFPDTLQGVAEVHLHSVGQALGYCLAQRVCLGQRQFLHACDILYRVLRRHGAVCDDMCAVLVSVFVHHPLQHLSSAVVVKVGVDIRQGDTVGVEESLEQEVVLQRVDFRDAEAVCHNRPCCRAAPRAHPHPEFLTGGVDEVLHDEEVSGKSHCLHYVQLEPYAFVNLLRQGLAVDAACSVVGEFRKIVRLELYAVDLVVASEFLYFLQPLFFRQLVLAVLVRGELLEEILFRELPPPLLFRPEILRYGEERHDGVALDVVCLHLVENLDSVCQGFGYVGEDLVHLLARLEPFLF